MTNTTKSYSPYCPDSASLRLWGAAFTDALDDLVTAGDLVLVSTAINWAGVSHPGFVADTLLAYAVYRFADTAQGDAPVFFEIAFYGMRMNGFSGAQDYPYVNIYTGVAYSGSGRLAFVGSGTPMYPTGTSPSSAVRELNAASDGSGIVMSIGMNGAGSTASTNSSSAGVFTIDRFRNTDGTPRTDGWAMIAWYIGAQTVSVDPVSATGQQLTATSGWPAVGMLELSSATPALNNAAETTLFPTWAGNRFGSYPLKMVMSYAAADFAPTPGTITPTFLGATRTYKRLGSGGRAGFDISQAPGVLCSIWWSD